jgi:hypothetical protein
MLNRSSQDRESIRSNSRSRRTEEDPSVTKQRMGVWAHETYISSVRNTHGQGPFSGCPDFGIAFSDPRLDELIPHSSVKFRADSLVIPIDNHTESNILFYTSESFGRVRLSNNFVDMGTTLEDTRLYMQIYKKC